MQKTNEKFMNYRKQLLNAGVFAVFAGTILVGFFSASPSRAESSSQNAAATPVFEYEVSTIKPYKPGADERAGMMRVGISYAPDGLIASGATLQMLVSQAYGVQNFQIIGAPDWFNTERFEFSAKMEGPVADALAKMSQDDRNLTRQKMLQALLADRFKLTIHRDTKELPSYSLMIGKSGPKFAEAKPVDAPSGAPVGRGGPGRGGMSVSAGPGGVELTANSSQMIGLVRTLSNNLRAPVIDKTGLTGNYDFTLKWMPDNFGGGGGPGFAAPPAGGAPTGAIPADPSGEAAGPTLMVALEEQLGLKLEKGKGQAEIIVIDHVEKVSDN